MFDLFLKSLAALILVCSLAAPAYAQPGDRDGFGEVERKDMSAGTLTIDGQVYRVTARTRLRDSAGHITTLAAIGEPQKVVLARHDDEKANALGQQRLHRGIRLLGGDGAGRGLVGVA